MTFVMLNPSTADATTDDPTLRRCIGFAEDWDCRRLIVVNLFAYRATLPGALLRAGFHAEGPENEGHVRAALADADITVMAWGAHPVARRVPSMSYQFCLGVGSAWCLGMTKEGSPRHPLYVSRETTLLPWKPARLVPIGATA